jgi:hypothetical protein
LSYCIAKTLQKFIIARLVVPIIWPIQEGTNLTQKEVTSLEEAGFSFDHLHRNNTQSLFGFQSSSSSNSHVLVMSCHNLVKLFNASGWLTTHGGKKMRQPFIFKITPQHTNNWEVGVLFFQCIIVLIVDVAPHGLDEFIIFVLMSNDMTL